MAAPPAPRRVVYTVFAGRRPNLDVHLRYVDRLLDEGLVHEVHLWDYTRDAADSLWMRSAFGSDLPLLFGAPSEAYRRVPLREPLRVGQTLSFRVRGRRDAHVKLSPAAGGGAQPRVEPIELVLGGWNNTRSVLREHGTQSVVAEADGPALSPDAFTRYDVTIAADGASVLVRRDGETVLSAPMQAGWGDAAADVSVASFRLNTVDFDLAPSAELLDLEGVSRGFRVPPPRLLPRYRVMDAPTKHRWDDYYAHYTPEAYPGCVVVKADDDTLFLDVPGFRRFLDARVADRDALLMFPSIVNNGVCAFHQQQAGLVPASVGDFPYDVLFGKLWESAGLCARLHEHFADNWREFVRDSARLPPLRHPVGDRISINLFAILSEDLRAYQEIEEMSRGVWTLDDEHLLSVVMPRLRGRAHAIHPGLVVAHLSFCQQEDTGLDLAALRARYARVADEALGTEAA